MAMAASSTEQKYLMNRFLLLWLGLFAGLCNPVNSQCLSKSVSLTAENEKLKKVLKSLEQRTGCYISYSDNVVDAQRLVTIRADSLSLEQVLAELFLNTGITFTQTSEQVLLYRKNEVRQARGTTISGFVYEKGSREPLNGALVFIPALHLSTETNNYGFFSLVVKSDSCSVYISYLGYKTRIFQVETLSDITLNIYLENTNKLAEAVVIDRKHEKISVLPRMSTIELPISQIRNVPALLGEKDIMKVIQLLPGIQKGNEGQSGFYTRGGGPDQNLIILDDAPVYNAYHLFGFFSLFNGDALKSVEITKGGFPARYGGRLSSVLNMTMKEGNKKEFHGEGGIGLLSSRFLFEGPLKKNQSSFLVSGRRTYADLILAPWMTKDYTVGYYFYDLNAKINWEIDGKNKIYLSSYVGNDRFYLKDKFEDHSISAAINWGNATGTLRWNHLFNSRLFSNVSVIYSDYKLSITANETVQDNVFELAMGSGIRDVQVKSDVDYFPWKGHHIRSGFSVAWHHFTPTSSRYRDDFAQRREEYLFNYEAFEAGFYAEDEMELSARWRANAGIRISSFGQWKHMIWRPEPRLTISYEIRKNLAAKASYAVMNQYIHLLSNTGIGLPTDIWVPSTDKVRNQYARQVAAGIAMDLPHNLMLSCEGYYKKLYNVITYREGASFIQISDPSNPNRSWQDKVTSGKAQSYGTEFLLQRKHGRFNGWIGYTLSWTIFQFDEVNGGKPYYARYDRRHDLSLVGIYKLKPGITVSMTWVYGTGNAITPPLASMFAVSHNPGGGVQNYRMVDGLMVNDYGQRNSVRMPAYHRLDAGVSFYKKKKRFERTLELSLYNSYNRKNAFFYYIAYTYENGVETRKLREVSLFPVIPSISYNISF